MAEIKLNLTPTGFQAAAEQAAKKTISSKDGQPDTIVITLPDELPATFNFTFNADKDDRFIFLNSDGEELKPYEMTMEKLTPEEIAKSGAFKHLVMAQAEVFGFKQGHPLISGAGPDKAIVISRP